MPTLRQRLRFLARSDRRYLWYLVLRRLGVRRLAQSRAGARLVVPLSVPGGVQLAYMSGRLDYDLLRRLLPACPGSFIDVGANVGLTLCWLKLLEPDRAWIGFEPSPTACTCIREVIRLNDFHNARLIEAGLSDRAGRFTLHAASGTDSSATMLEVARTAEQDHAHEVDVLDGAALSDSELRDKVGIVKIDVEGMELEVVRGLRAVLKRDRPLLLLEILPVPDDGTERAKKLRARQGELLAELRDLDYRLAQSVGGVPRDVQSPSNEAGAAYDYLAIPAERYTEIHAALQG